MIRVGGRLHNANLAEATKHPMILHQKSQIVLLLLNDLHQRHFHASARVMLAIVAERFYISGLRSHVRRVIHECVPCRCTDVSPCTQQMGVLPADRVRPASPFLNVVKWGYTRKPVYMCVFLFVLSLRQFTWNLWVTCLRRHFWQHSDNLLTGEVNRRTSIVTIGEISLGPA